jgi:hypothetical protein
MFSQCTNKWIDSALLRDGITRSYRREELVEVEGQGVELLAPGVLLEAPELVPPVVPSVLPHRALVQVHRVVQEVGHQPRHERLVREGHVDHVVELPKWTKGDNGQ